MPTIKLTDIIIPEDRQRKSIDEVALGELIKSIRAVGIIHPIVLDDDNRLLVGRRRLLAFERIGHTEIPFVRKSELSPLQQKVVEFDENHKRASLTWAEEAQAIAEIHEMMSRTMTDEGLVEHTDHTFQDTADVLKVSEAKVQQDVQLARTLHSNPEVAEKMRAHDTRKGALLAYYRERELAIDRELARRRILRAKELGGSVEGLTHLSTGRIHNADCRTILATLPDNSVDLIITDPPWGIDLSVAATWSKQWTERYDDSPEATLRLIEEIAPLLFRLLKPSCHLYTFAPLDLLTWTQWNDILTKAGFTVRTRPLIWAKSTPGITEVYTSFIPSYEGILFASKLDGGKSRLFQKAIPDAWTESRQRTDYHPNEKPCRIIDAMIEASSTIGEVVLDPFCGGGSIISRAFVQDRTYIGIEQDMHYAHVCVQRLRDLEATKDELKAALGEEMTDNG